MKVGGEGGGTTSGSLEKRPTDANFSSKYRGKMVSRGLAEEVKNFEEALGLVEGAWRRTRDGSTPESLSRHSAAADMSEWESAVIMAYTRTLTVIEEANDLIWDKALL